VESRSRQAKTDAGPSAGQGPGGSDPDATGRAEAVPDSVDPDALDALQKVCREVLVPLVTADGGVMYLVKASSDEAHFHLTGTCSGCPGASLTRDGVIVPAVRSVLPKARVVVTTGYLVPEGAQKLEA
jgi:Fe-S cluster biogenesis protein NfuA